MEKAGPLAQTHKEFCRLCQCAHGNMRTIHAICNMFKKLYVARQREKTIFWDLEEPLHFRVTMRAHAPYGCDALLASWRNSKTWQNEPSSVAPSRAQAETRVEGDHSRKFKAQHAESASQCAHSSRGGQRSKHRFPTEGLLPVAADPCNRVQVVCWMRHGRRSMREAGALHQRPKDSQKRYPIDT